jgi:CubicO group peptidase (beta-lactamase class C family)
MMRITSFSRLSLAAVALSLAACSSDDTKPSGGADGGDGGPGEVTEPRECNGVELPPRATDHTVLAAADLEAYFPTDEWRTATPQQANMDAAKLQSALEYKTEHSNTTGILVLRAGYIVAEQYASGFDENTRIESYSMAKSFTSALVGIAIDEKKLTTDQKICEFYSDVWDCSDDSDKRTHIEVLHTMNVETGLAWHEDWRSSQYLVNNDTFTASASNAFLDYVLAKPGTDEPGTKKRYSTGDPSLLSGVLQGVTGMTALEFARQVLFTPLGMPGVQWNADTKGRTTTYAGLQATLREYGKFGFLYSKHGAWDGKQVVPGDWVDFTTRAKDPCSEQYRYLWHINLPLRLGETSDDCGDFPSCDVTAFGNYPSDAFFAEGIQGQFIFIAPSMDLVVVRGASDQFGSEYWDEYAKEFLTKVLDAVNPS